MLVVDRNIFAQLQADPSGIDFMELSANLIRAQSIQNGSRTSTFESEDTSKGLSLDFLPPAYEDIFGIKNSDLPPSYSEITLTLKNLSGGKLNDRQTDEHERILNMSKRKEGILRTSSAPYIFSDRIFDTSERLRRDFVSLDEDIKRNVVRDDEESTRANVSEVASGFERSRYEPNGSRRNKQTVNHKEFVDRESSV